MTDQAVTETPVESEAVSEDAELANIFDKLGAEQAAPEAEVGASEEAPVEAEAAAEDADEAEPEPKKVEAPGDIPNVLKRHWANLPEDAREAIATSQREMGAKLADMGRQMQGIAPIRDVLVQAVKDIPSLAQMKPAEVASQVMQLAKISGEFNSNPLQTILGLVDKHNMRDALAQALGGNAQAAQSTAALHQEIAGLKHQLSQYASPDYIRSQVSAATAEERAMAEVTDFSRSVEHWDALENYIPQFVPIMHAKLGVTASNRDIIAGAYELALQTFMPEAKARGAAADEAARAHDPARTEAALKAKSANVRAKDAGKPRPLTEDEELSRAFDRMQ